MRSVKVFSYVLLFFFACVIDCLTAVSTASAGKRNSVPATAAAPLWNAV